MNDNILKSLVCGLRVEWVPKHEGKYAICENGDVFSISHNNTGKPKKLKHSKNRQGYPFVSLRKNGVIENKTIHRLLAQLFIPNAYNKPEVNHINGVKSDYSLNNLEWVTRSENVKHAYDILGHVKIQKKGAQHHQSKPIIAVRGLTELRFNCLQEAASYFKKPRQSINKAVRGKIKTLYGFKWRYADIAPAFSKH